MLLALLAMWIRFCMQVSRRHVRFYYSVMHRDHVIMKVQGRLAGEGQKVGKAFGLGYERLSTVSKKQIVARVEK